MQFNARLSRLAAPVVLALVAVLLLQSTTARVLHASARITGDPDAARTVRVGENAGTVVSYDNWMQSQRAYPSRFIPAAGYPQGVAAAQAMPRATSARWHELGPLFAPNAGLSNPTTGATSTVSGRLTSVAVNPTTCGQTTCGTIYVGAASGGVWKTTDSGTTWKALTDNQQALSVGAITLDPVNPNIVYVATGEPDLSGDSFAGAGILRSTDGGATWTTLGATQFLNRAVAAIIVDPRTAGGTNATLYAVSTVAVSGDSPSGGGSRITNPYLPPVGFFVSRDGGVTWTRSNPPGTEDGSQSLVIDPTDPNVLYSGFVPDITDNPTLLKSPVFANSGVYRSGDDGKTWTHLTTGLPADAYGTIKLAIAPSDTRVLYSAYDVAQDTAFVPAPRGADHHQEVYRSDDGGAAWSRLTGAPNVCASQCRYDMPVTVDPANPHAVYLGGSANYDYGNGTSPECSDLLNLDVSCSATVAKTSDGGLTWADLGENGAQAPLHPDDHAIVLDPKNANVIYTATDGGLFVSGDGGGSWKDLNKGLGTLQFTGLAVSRNGSIYAGTQDNGTFAYSGGVWQIISGGDGGYTATDPKTSSISYNSQFGPYLYRNDHNGLPNSNVFIGAFQADFLIRGQGQFYQPLAVAPSRPNVLYYGTYRLWRSEHRGGSDGNGDGDATNDPKDTTDWAPISFDLRCAKRPSDPTTLCNVPTARGISVIAVSPLDANVVVVGTANGRVWTTHNALATVKTDHSCQPWTNIKDMAICENLSGPSWHEIDHSLPTRYVTSLHFAPKSSSAVYITYSGFDQNTRGHAGHVFLTRNGGASWKSITGTKKGAQLPNLPFSDLEVNPKNGHLYASADFGIYASANGGRIWSRIDTGLPAALVLQMQVLQSKSLLVVATHGRGMWETPAP